jgi:hypothetical protein
MRATFEPDSAPSGCRRRSNENARTLLAMGAGSTSFPPIVARSIHEAASSGDTM